MKIEVLFPELCNLYGDLFNVKYLEKCLPEAQRIDTPLGGDPVFLQEEPALIYMGPMSERSQQRVIEKLLPYRQRLEELIQGGTAFLLTGNALEVLGNYIENEDGSRLEGLGLLPLFARRDMMHRHNSVFLGNFQGEKITGFKSQFTMAWPQEDINGLFAVEKGTGLHPSCPFEGLRVGNLFATYLLGPILPLNPGLARAVLGAMGAGHAPLAFEKEVEAAYQQRLRDFEEKVRA